MLAQQILFELKTSRQALGDLLRNLLTQHPVSSASAKNTFGSAMDTTFAAVLAFASGKALVFASGLASLGKARMMGRTAVGVQRDVAHNEALM